MRAAGAYETDLPTHTIYQQSGDRVAVLFKNMVYGYLITRWKHLLLLILIETIFQSQLCKCA